jgi:hypothetical protein
MSESMQSFSDEQFIDISPIPEIVHYVGLINRIADLSSEVVDYQKIVQIEETKRIEIQKKSEQQMTLISRQLDLYEKDLIADIDRLKLFVEGTMDAVHKLIEKERYELADVFHQRVTERLEGRVSNVTDQFNERIGGRNFFLIEEKDS